MPKNSSKKKPFAATANKKWDKIMSPDEPTVASKQKRSKTKSDIGKLVYQAGSNKSEGGKKKSRNLAKLLAGAEPKKSEEEEENSQDLGQPLVNELEEDLDEEPRRGAL